MSPAHVIALIEHSQVAYRIEHSAPVQAIVGTLLTTLVGLAVAAFFNRRQIAWRAYVDAPITLDAGMAKTMGSRVIHKIYVADNGHGEQSPSGGGLAAPTTQATPIATAEVEVPWLVLLRIRNSGRVTISGKEFNTRLTFTFPGREVRDVAVIDGAGDDPDKILLRPKGAGTPPPTAPTPSVPARILGWLRGQPVASTFATSSAVRPMMDYIQLSDEFALNRHDRITIMAVLSGTPADSSNKIAANGKLIGGRIVREAPRGGPGMRSVVSAAFILLLLGGLLLGLLLSPSPTTQTASQCVGGQLTLTGSTAFAPVGQQIAKAYDTDCPTAHITVSADNSGSVNGLNTVIDAGPRSAGTLIAMSDGPAPTGGSYPALDGTPVAIITFEVVVNHGVGLYDLTDAQIKGVYDGAYTNWRQLGGPNLPVRIISRDFGSGSRRAFDAYVLGGAIEPSPTSFDCRTNSAPSAPVILCDAQTTGELLSGVETIPGAIGYAQTGDIATAPPGTLQPVALNGLLGSFGNIGRAKNNYQYWTTEYIYTYGPPTGLAAAFLRYLSNAVGLNDLADGGYTPCSDADHPSAARLCAQADS